MFLIKHNWRQSSGEGGTPAPKSIPERPKGLETSWEAIMAQKNILIHESN